MDRVEEMIRDAKEFESDTDSILLKLVKVEERAVINMNINDQLFNGLNADGQQIRPPYRPLTVIIKKQLGQPFDRVTLRNTGKFINSWFIDFRNAEFFLDAGDQKKIKLLRKYSSRIFGLTDKNVNKLIGLIEDDFVSAFRKKIIND